MDHITPERQKRILEVLNKRQDDLIVVLENIFDPHNLSACLRSCDSVGVNEVYLLYHSGQSKPEISNTSSSSASKWLNYSQFDNVESCFNELKEKGFIIYTTALSENSIDLFELDFTRKIAVVFGNEHYGVSQKAIELADGNFLIPQVGMIKSLNISVACAVTLYEAYRQKNLNGDFNSCKLTSEKFEKQLKIWTKPKIKGKK